MQFDDQMNGDQNDVGQLDFLALPLIDRLSFSLSKSTYMV